MVRHTKPLADPTGGKAGNRPIGVAHPKGSVPGGVWWCGRRPGTLTELIVTPRGSRELARIIGFRIKACCRDAEARRMFRAKHG